MTTEIGINNLKEMAMLYYESDVTEDKIRQNNVTDILDAEMTYAVQHGELWNEQILGEVTSGKSTVMIKRVIKLNKALGRTTTIKDIAADQLEYMRLVMNPQTQNQGTGCDEWNELGSRGLNASTEQSLRTYFSNVHAQRYIHRISCSPTTITDPNATVILQTLGTNRQKQTTRVLVYYRFWKLTEPITQLIGYADIYVGDILKTDLYKKYRERKFLRMDLLTKEAITDVREMEFAELILETYKELKPLAKLGQVTRDIGASFVDVTRRQNKQLLSLLASEDIISKVISLITFETKTNKLLKQIKDEKKKDKPNPQEILELQEIAKELIEKQARLLKEYTRLVNINKEYQKI